MTDALREALRVAKRMTDAAPLCGMPGVANLYREAAAVIESLCTALQEPAPVVQPEFTDEDLILHAEAMAWDDGSSWHLSDHDQKALRFVTRCLRATVTHARATAAPSQLVEDARAKAYDELIMAVARKHPGETRHQTALRYIRQAESANLIDTGAKASIAKGAES